MLSVCLGQAFCTFRLFFTDHETHNYATVNNPPLYSSLLEPRDAVISAPRNDRVEVRCQGMSLVREMPLEKLNCE